jgi:two-component system chemotaxis sensor kinase CheA
VATLTATKNLQVPAKDGAAAATPQVSSIRVDLDKLEKVVNLVGEIVISQAMLTEHMGALSTERFGGLIKGIEELSQHTRSLQDSVMAMRAQPVKSVFQRMPRLVREVAAATGKKVRLVLHGEETEIDKTVIEQLYDPLVHMMRNSVDHGIETPEERAAAGKPAEGTVRLSAGHAGGRIIIEIADDGKGINRERVFQKAVAKGLIPADLSLTRTYTYGLPAKIGRYQVQSIPVTHPVLSGDRGQKEGRPAQWRWAMSRAWPRPWRVCASL